MLNTALRTHPLSFSKVCDTFGATDCTAARTHLGRQTLVNLNVLSAVPDGFVAELGSKLRPAGIEHGLGQAGSGKSGRIHITNADERIHAHEPRREFVLEVPAAMGDLGMNSPRAALMTSALSDGEFIGVAREKPGVADLLSGGKTGEILQTQIDSNLTGAAVLTLGDLELEIEIPAATCILRETAAMNVAIEGPTEPQSVATLEEKDRIAIHADSAGRLERNPAEGFAAAPPAAAPLRIARTSKLLANGLYSVRVQAELTRGTVGEVNQVVSARPASVPALGGSLRFAAEIPHKVDTSRLRIECATAAFNAITTRQNHLYILPVTCVERRILGDSQRLKFDARRPILPLSFRPGERSA